jgi:phosphatidylglycerophosphatase A
MKSYQEKAIEMLKLRGVSIQDIVNCVHYLQKDYNSNLDNDILTNSVLKVLEKREVQYALMTAIELDMNAEKNRYLDKELEDIVKHDLGLFGTDEVLAYGICNLYGSIALTNFGFLDKQKFGIVAYLNDEGKKEGICHTFLDDMVAAIAAAAASRFAHS